MPSSTRHFGIGFFDFGTQLGTDFTDDLKGTEEKIAWAHLKEGLTTRS